jgi:hypothetical protein
MEDIYELSLAKKEFKNTKRWFGLGAFNDCWQKFVAPLRRDLKFYIKKSSILHESNKLLAERLERTQIELSLTKVMVSNAAKELEKINLALANEDYHTKYVVEFSHPEGGSVRSIWTSPERAKDEYMAIKSVPPRGENIVLTISKVTILRRTYSELTDV